MGRGSPGVGAAGRAGVPRRMGWLVALGPNTTGVGAAAASGVAPERRGELATSGCARVPVAVATGDGLVAGVAAVRMGLIAGAVMPGKGCPVGVVTLTGVMLVGVPAGKVGVGLSAELGGVPVAVGGGVGVLV